MPRFAYVRTVAAAAGLAVALAACSSAADGDEAHTGAPPLSLAQVFGIDTDGDVGVAREQTAQRLIAECMSERGWEYVEAPTVAAEEPWDAEGERATIERQGFGIVYWTLNPDEAGSPWDSPADPNARVRASLTDAELIDYFDDLYGSADEWDEVLASNEPFPEFGLGCEGHGYAQAYGERDNGGLAEVMFAFYDEVDALVEADPRIVAQRVAWRQCMSDQGYSFTDRAHMWSEGYNELYARFDAVMAQVAWVDPMDGWSEQQVQDFWNTATPEEIDALFARVSYDLDDEQRAQLEQIMTDEIALAVADHDCSRGHGDLYQQVFAEIESDFVATNRDRIDEAIELARG